MRSRVILKTSSRGRTMERMVAQTRAKKWGIDIGVLDAEQAVIASYHEFGTRTIPRRSFLQPWFDVNRDALARRIVDIGKSFWATNRSIQSSLHQEGGKAITGIQAIILGIIPPPLAESTRRSKNPVWKDVPLIDQGRLFRAISYRIINQQQQ
jgi:hypothetical protein